VSVGVKVVVSVWTPGRRTAPEVGVYTKVPGTLDVALSCTALSAVPYGIEAGEAQVMVGVAGATVTAMPGTPVPLKSESPE
jgi:hypothetical protein